MNEPEKRARGPRKAISIDDAIALAKANLAKLQEKKKEKERRDQEINDQAITALIGSAGLNLVGVTKWREVLPRLQELLAAEAKPEPKARKRAAAVERKAELEPA